MLSLIVYAGIIQKFSPQIPQNSEQDKMLSLFFPPLVLIFIAGYAFRDDLRLIPQTMYGTTKGIVRAFKGCSKQVSGNDHPVQAENDQVVSMEGTLNDVSDDEGKKEPYLSNGLTNPDGTPLEEGKKESAYIKSQHDADDDSIV